MDTPVPGIAQLLHQQQQMMATLVDFLRSTDRATAFRHSATRSQRDIRPTLEDGCPRPLQSRGQ